jgi:hypothetical protein
MTCDDETYVSSFGIQSDDGDGQSAAIHGSLL